MPSTDAAVLRDRARRLRCLAALVHRRLLTELCRAAGDDTWRGPVAEGCRDDLVTAQRRLDRAGDDLLRRAAALERTADELDAAVRAGW